ncbi:nucleotidyltransferase family protein [Halieaceae bacterium IMCC14734]|uniref:Nucleotidyltransferase family protein n=1 Tax=Candidatus Litorirhabdus singularis TaxID=2518993 RepID=A0ABT3TL51_9GAMM|nr:nucleotidyltransferase family protein [Candidatus Litorirhabdus singularis]MCX2982067.1 nucleotidyltransferase family protein [Candidatus Litorirhabdus singularis]
MSRGAALILAAGAGSRFGSLKQLAPLQGKPLLQHAVDAATAVLPDHVYCVLGNGATEIESAVNGARFIAHEQWASGMGSSLAAGVDALAEQYDWLLVMLGDQPAVTAQHLQDLINELPGFDCVCSRYGNIRGVPAIFTRGWYQKLTGLRGDRGAQALLRDNRDLREIELAAALWDVDTPADLTRHQDGKRS